MELNAEQIIKALDVCGEYTHGTTCNSCPYMHIELADNEICSNRLSQDALALIKELTEENEDLKAIAEQYQNQFEEAKADTLSEMQNRLAQYIGTYTDKSFVYVSALFKLIDQIAKELIGDA